MYLVVRSLKQDDRKLDYKLRKNDIIKLGRVKFKVKELRVKALEEEKDKKRQKVKKYQKKLQEEINRIRLVAGEGIAEERKEDAIKVSPGAFEEESSINPDLQLEGEESFVEVDCVLPQD